jgi:hypothetical protein
LVEDGKKFEKASDALLFMRAEIASAMEPFSETPFVVAATQTYDRVTGEQLGAMCVYTRGGFDWTSEDLYNFKRYGLVDYSSECAKAAFEHFLELVSK